MKQWYEDNSELLATHKRYASAHLDDVKFEFDADGHFQIIGTLIVLLPSGSPLDRIRLRLAYPRNFGQRDAAIQVFDEARRFRAPDPEGHINDDSSFCWGVPGESRVNFSKKDALQGFLTSLKIFFAHQWVYQRAKERELLGGPKARWSGTARSHGSAGLREAIKSRGGLGRNDSCPCGSGEKYKNCHMRVLEKGKR